MLVFEWAFFVVLLLFCLLCGTAGVLCAACCVRPGCSVRPPSTAHDLPSSVWSLCVPVGGGPPARSPHASLTARSGRSRGPPWPCRHPPAPRPGPTAAHGHHSQAHRALHTCGAGSLFGSSTRRLEARPGPATAHGHHSQAHPISEPSHAKPSPPDLTPLIREPTPNFACNSLATLSNFEF